MDEYGARHSAWNRLKLCAVVLVAVFGVTLAIVVGNRLSDEALAVLAGAVCGVSAAIPTSLLIVAIMRRRDEPRPSVYAAPPHNYPPVVVVTAPHTQSPANAWGALPAHVNHVSAPAERRFTIVGSPAEYTQEVASHEQYA